MRNTWDQDLSTFPPRTLQATWGMREAIDKDTKVSPMSLGTATLPTIQGKELEYRPRLPELLRFTDLKQIVASIKGNGLTVEVQGPVLPGHTLDLGKIQVMRTASRTTKTHPDTIVNNCRSCEFTYDCLETALDDLMLCSRHSSRVRAFIAGNPTLQGTWPSETPLIDLEWSVPTSSAKTTADFKTILEILHTFDMERAFCIDFEGIPNTRKGLAAIPVQLGIVNVGSQDDYMGFFDYSLSPSNLVRKLVSEKAIDFKQGWTTDVITKFTKFFQKWSSRTPRKPASGHQENLRDLGLTGKKYTEPDGSIVFYWGTSKMDKSSLGRIMYGCDNLVEPETDALCSTINLSTFVCLGLGLSKWSLGYVFQGYFPHSDARILNFHDALFDAKALAHILECVRRDTKQLWDSIKAAEKEGL
jgi:hypothetical protein